MPHNHTLYACTLATCPISYSVYNYRPSIGANATFLALFALSALLHLAQGLRWRRRAFMVTVLVGCSAEIVGYAGRIASYNNPFAQGGFLTQICCLTIAPAFFAAGIYFCLGEIVTDVGLEASRIRPRGYAAIFIPCDVVSLILQGAGGGIASVASQNGRDSAPGTHIMVAGLSFQVASMALFIALAGEYAFRVRRLGRPGGAEVGRVDAKKVHIFASFFSLAILCIFIRCVYRVVELSEGWKGRLIKDETTFIVLEGVMVVIAVYALHIGHPGFLGKASSRHGDGGVGYHGGEEKQAGGVDMMTTVGETKEVK